MTTVIDPVVLAAHLTTAARRVNFNTLAECDSTNLVVGQMARDGAPNGTVILAERQTAGRGRRGRTWHQSSNALAFSLLWQLPEQRPANGLSLAVGLAITEAIAACSADNAQLKWPNDVLVDERKVAGILIEGLPQQKFVIGIGINLGGNLENTKPLPAEIAAIAGSVQLHGTRVAFLANVLDHLVSILDEFAAHGFAALRARWLAHHAYQDQIVTLTTGDNNSLLAKGICRGIDESGALLVETVLGVQTFHSGEISLRLLNGAAAI